METHNGSVLVTLGCYNKNTMVLKDGLNHKLYFVPVLEAGKSMIKESAESVSGADLFSGLQTAVSSLHPHMCERDRSSLSCHPLCKGTNPIHEGSAPMTYLPLECPTSKYHHVVG